MENPFSRNRAVQLIAASIEKWEANHKAGAIGLSLAAFIGQELERSGYLTDRAKLREGDEVTP